MPVNIRVTVNTFERATRFDSVQSRELDREGAVTEYRAFRRTDLEPGAGQ